MLDTVFLFDQALPFRLEMIALEERRAIQVRDVRVTPFCTTHLDRTRAQFGRKYRADFSAYCFLIEHGGRRLGHSADLGEPEDLEPLMTEPLDLLVSELSHFTTEKMFSYLRKRDIGRVAFVHIGRTQRKDMPGLRRLARRTLGKRCVFPVDGDEIDLNCR
jgi:L-ascorbate metabolism protein UlaG (beta-lactamase superfamily)